MLKSGSRGCLNTQPPPSAPSPGQPCLPQAQGAGRGGGQNTRCPSDWRKDSGPQGSFRALLESVFPRKNLRRHLTTFNVHFDGHFTLNKNRAPLLRQGYSKTNTVFRGETQAALPSRPETVKGVPTIVTVTAHFPGSLQQCKLDWRKNVKQ